MKSTKSLQRRTIVIFFLFMLLHQTDKLLIGPLKSPISETFGLSNFQFGLIITGALIVGTVLYPLWGYLYDRYARARLLALASFIWGSTTWLSAIAPNYTWFLVTRASTGIDDSSYPGLYSLVADYFGPKQRSRIYGILQIAQPIGYLLGMLLALMLAPVIGWRTVFYITGGLGVLLALAIYFGVKEMPRGQSEPEFEESGEVPAFHFSWQAAATIFRKPTMWFIFGQGFAGVFPWNVITYFFFDYLEKERLYDSNSILTTMVPVILVMAAGFFVGGSLGDALFRRTRKGRVLTSSVGVFMGAVTLMAAIKTPLEAHATFFIFMLLAALFIPFSAPNVVATIFDVTTPEVRSTAHAVEYFIENTGAASAPALAGYLADKTSMGTAILWVSVVAWAICFVIYLGALRFIEKDIQNLRDEMSARSLAQNA